MFIWQNKRLSTLCPPTQPSEVLTCAHCWWDMFLLGPPWGPHAGLSPQTPRTGVWWEVFLEPSEVRGPLSPCASLRHAVVALGSDKAGMKASLQMREETLGKGKPRAQGPSMAGGRWWARAPVPQACSTQGPSKGPGVNTVGASASAPRQLDASRGPSFLSGLGPVT